MIHSVYSNFRDPTEKFYKKEPRAFCYDLSRDLLKKSKIEKKEMWYTDENAVNAILLLMYCWNFASRITKTLTRLDIEKLLEESINDFNLLEHKNILNFTTEDEEAIGKLYFKFKKVLGQTGASKALSLIDWSLFVMWDTKIRGAFRRMGVTGIGNGESAQSYINFLKVVKKCIIANELTTKINKGSPIAKKLDEFHYLFFVKR